MPQSVHVLRRNVPAVAGHQEMMRVRQIAIALFICLTASSLAAQPAYCKRKKKPPATTTEEQPKEEPKSETKTEPTTEPKVDEAQQKRDEEQARVEAAKK